MGATGTLLLGILLLVGLSVGDLNDSRSVTIVIDMSRVVAAVYHIVGSSAWGASVPLVVYSKWLSMTHYWASFATRWDLPVARARVEVLKVRDFSSWYQEHLA